jgi:hypothetical protein
MKRPAFTLIELILASTLSVLLMAGVLVILAGLSHDARGALGGAVSSPDLQGTMDLLRWDLSNAQTMYPSSDGRTLVLIGHGSIAPGTRTPNGRLVRVTYNCQLRRDIWRLTRSQQYIDDPARPQPWTDLVAQGVIAVEVLPVGGAAGAEQFVADARGTFDEQAKPGVRVPAWVRLRVYGPSVALEKQICVK